MQKSELPNPSASIQVTVLVSLGLITLLGSALWAFAPGLGGDLIFDDYPNFLPWQDIGDITSWEKVLLFTFSGTGTPGRPLSLLSFLVDDQSWSPDTYALKRTNLAIHLINSALILWLCMRLIDLMLPTSPPKKRLILAFFASGIWTLHPLQVSNVSYIIQRMNLLSTTLELIGLLIFIHGRGHLTQAPRKALLLCSIGIGIFMPLAILAKENGLLLCAFALLIERYCFTPSLSSHFRAWKGIFLWLPLAAFLIYCLKEYDFFTQKLAIRNFTSWERLLTQGPIIHDYLGKLLLPQMSGSTLYFENYPVSRSLFNPLSTTTSWLLIISLLTIAWRLRYSRKLISFGIFFYFVGHLMESTLIPLELYFEHRNYFPQLGLWLALAGLISEIHQQRLLKVCGVASLLLVLMLMLMTRANATLWGNTDLQTAMWYRENPGSQRATLSYINLLLKKSKFEEVEVVFTDSMQRMPNNLGLVVSKRYVDCYLLGKTTSFDDIPALARRSDYELSSLLMLERMQNFANDTPSKQSTCQHATQNQVANIYLAILKNPNFNKPSLHSRLNENLSEIAAQNGLLDDAMHYLDKAYNTSRNPIYPFRQATLLHDAGLNEEALKFLQKANDALTLSFALYYPELETRIRELRNTISKKQASQTHS